MKKVVYRIIIDFEKEEKWLNEMSAKGYQLVSFTLGRYLFEVGEAGEYQYKIQLLENFPNHPESQAYIKFLGENGVEYVDSSSRWVYLRTKSTDGIEMLHSDVQSRLVQQKSIFKMFIILLVAELCIAVSNIHNAWVHPSPFLIGIVLILLILIGVLGTVTVKSYRKMRQLEKDATIFE